MSAIEIGELARLLDARVRTLAPELLPNGHREGRFWRTGSIADDPGQALAVNLDGPMAGKWTDFSAPQGSRERSGDMLTLVALVMFGGAIGEACKWARSMLGLDDMDPNRLQRVRAQAAERAKSADDEARRKAERNRRLALGLFVSGRPIRDTPAELYLAGRGIDLSCLERDGRPRQPRALAFHEGVWCEEAGRELPCLLAAVLDDKARHIATHRTWLARNADGDWIKAPLAQPKMALGAFGGGYIPLWKGLDLNPLDRVADGTAVAVSEGIEDGMTVACACPEMRVIAAVALNNIGRVPIPVHAGVVTIVGQNDPEGSKAAQSLAKEVATLQSRGLTVAMAKPPAGVKDANDLARGVAA